MSTHDSHPEIVKRLKRAEGHLRKTMAMIQDERACLDVAQQLHAVERAIAQAKKAFIHDHIDHCLDGSAHGGDLQEMAREFKSISKYL